MRKPKPIEQWLFWRVLISCEKWILFISSLACVLIITYSVILRYITKSDLIAIEEITTIVAIWLYYIGGAFGSYEDSHIKADFFAAYVKNKTILRIRNCFVYGVVVILSAIITKWGLDYVAWSLSAGGTSTTWHFPLIISQIPITICFVLMLFYSTYHFVRKAMNKFDDIQAPTVSESAVARPGETTTEGGIE